MRIFGPINSGLAVGGDGVATINADSSVKLSGLLVGVYLRYNGSPPAGTTDVTLKTKGGSAPSYNLLVLTNGATDGLYLPRMASVSTAGVASTSVDHVIPVDDILNLAIAQANAGDSVDAWLFME